MVSLRALVLGGVDVPPAPAGFDLRAWHSVDVLVPGPLAARPLEAGALRLPAFDPTPPLWADVLVVREPLTDLARALVDVLTREPALLRGRELVADLTEAATVTTRRMLERLALREADAAVARSLAGARPGSRSDRLVSV